MNRNGPIVIIEDDQDDRELFAIAYKRLKYPNKLVFFDDGEEALIFLNRVDTVPFLIISDINMPKINGFELRAKLKTDEQLAIKCIPYIFFSTLVDQQAVIDAYSMSVQGFFLKDFEMAELGKTITVIVEYWKRCEAPHNF